MTDRAQKLWPRLGFEHVGGLDYIVPQYDVKWLTYAAKQLQDAPRRPIDHAIGDCLLRLAKTRLALKKMNLNRYRSHAPQSVRALNVAVHSLAQRELDGKGKSSRSLGRVADAWDMKDKSVKDARRKSGRARAAEALEHLVKLCTTRPHQPLSRLEVLEALCADMRARARLPWFKLRKKSRRRK